MWSGNAEFGKWFMLIKLLKIGRLWENIMIIMKNTRSSLSMGCFFLSLFSLYGLLLHIQACGLGFIGRWELQRESRYDGKSLFRDFETKPYLTLGPFVDLSPYDQYMVCVYLSGQVMQAVSYGDLIPYAMSEQIWIIAFSILTALNRAFLLVKMTKYLIDM